MTLTNLLLVLLLLEVTYLLSRSTGSAKQAPSKQTVYVDTSALMDARIITAAQTGFIPNHLTVPKSVIDELQLLADQADSEKRLRARRGLDVISELKEIDGLTVAILEDGAVGDGGVDSRLVELALKKGGSICTIDFNLNKAASAQGVKVLNINELAGSIRMAFLPGETISLALTQKGQNSTQAVGYLSDGTMVVVDKAAAMIGSTIEIEFVRSLQTSAGRMMFAKLAKAPTSSHDASKPQNSNKNDSANGRKQTNASRQSVKPAQKKQSRGRMNEDSLLSLVNEQSAND